VKKNQVKRNLVLGILFFLPVVFLLFLYPSTHNYIPLDVVNQNVLELEEAFSSESSETVALKDNITIICFFGKKPLDYSISASNLKELVYDKFKGFKRFQIVAIMPNGTESQVEDLKQKVNNYDDVRFWYYVFGEPNAIERFYRSLKTKSDLNPDLSSEEIFIVDKELNQRGRKDDRDKKELDAQPLRPLYSYNSIDIGEIKNKMSDDMRVLFTEYRQKRKGTFDSSKRRANDLNYKDEQAN